MAMTPSEAQVDAESRSVVDTSGGWIRSLLRKGTRAVGLILLAFVAWVLVRVVVDPGAYLSFDPAILVAIGLVGGGVLLLRGQQPAYDEVDRVAVVPRPSSPLGILTLSVAFLTVGALILVGNLGVADVTVGHITAASLTAVAIGLIVGAWWGRSRVLIALGVVMVPLVIAGGFMHLPLRGTIGSRWINTRSIDQVESRYELLGGTLNMHLSDLRNFSGERVIDISIAAGNATIFVPERIALTITGHIEFGNAAIGNGREEGADLVLSNSLEGKPGAGHLTINFTGGIASLYVERFTDRFLGVGRRRLGDNNATRNGMRSSNGIPAGGDNVQRHETDAVSLTCGVIFLVIGVLFLSGEVDAFDFVADWALPSALLAIGLVLGAVALGRYRRTKAEL